MEALSKAPANFSGAPITVVPDVPNGAEELFLVVRDSNNRVVDTREIPVSDKPYSWDGNGLNGTRLPDGAYAFSVEARARGEVVGTGDVRSYARVTETRIDGDKTLVGFDGGGFVDSSEVSGLRAPQT
jgi:flagellar basal-body rod modification protein FlgD